MEERERRRKKERGGKGRNAFPKTHPTLFD